jgi:alpha-L-fucosidase
VDFALTLERPVALVALAMWLIVSPGCSSPSRSVGQGSGSGGSAAGGTGGGSSAAAGTSGGAGGSSGGPGAGGSAGGAASGGAAGMTGTGGAGGAGATDVTTAHLDQLKRSFLTMQFGIWHHFGILTYTGTWAQANLPIDDFDPGDTLNPQQWAQAAKSAGATFGVLTTRHHDGFALWPSQASDFNVGHTTWYAQHGGQPAPDDQGDVVQQFVDGYRAEGLTPVLYYSIWDTTFPVTATNGALTPAMIQYLTTQLTELLTNYGQIPFLILDGWSWEMGHHAAEYAYLHDLIKSLQPDILIVDHEGLQSPFEDDLVMYEEPKNVFTPADNTWAAVQGQKVNQKGGNDWFWSSNISSFLSVSAIVDAHINTLVPRHANFILNCPPNNQGLLDASIVTLLGQVGTYRQSHPAPGAPDLPSQGPTNSNPYYVVTATASSGTAGNAIDGLNDVGAYTVWQSTGAAPQWVQMDLGAVKPTAFVGYLPPYTGSAPATSGLITGYEIDTSTDGTTFTAATSGSWPADGRLQAATFGPVQARYVRLIATAVNSGDAAATEVDVGGPQTLTFATPNPSDWGH